MRNFLRIASDIFIVVSVCVIAVAGWHIYGILSNYSESNKEYETVKEKYVSEKRKETEGGGQEAPIDECWGFTPGRPPEIDIEGLQKENPDIVAWIYIPGLEISYPVLQAEDNEKYLHTTYMGTYAYAGSIFIDCQNTFNFFDRNTIVYGHNMNNGSMFGKLRNYVDLADPPFDPYVWIITKEQELCYRMFSSYITTDEGDAYLLFDKDDGNFPEWEKKVRSYSRVEFEEIPFGENDHVITLSTCHSDHVHRRVVHAKMIYSQLREFGQTSGTP